MRPVVMLVGVAVVAVVVVGAVHGDRAPAMEEGPASEAPDRTVEHGRQHIFVERDDGIARLLKPNISTMTDGPSWDPVRVRTNAHGLRDEPVQDDDAETLTVLVLGDSFTFGTGVPAEQRYTELVETRLRLRYDRPVQVISAGIPSWGVENYYQYLRGPGLAMEPDIVVTAFIRNDRFSLRELEEMYDEAGERTDDQEEYLRAFERRKQERIKDTSLEERGFSRLYDIHDLAIQHGVTDRYYALDAIWHPETLTYLEEWEQETGHRVHWSPAVFRAHWGHTPGNVSLTSQYRISDTNADPSAAGHRLLAGPLYRMLVEAIEGGDRDTL